MSEKLMETMTELLQVMSGQLQATQVIQDVLVSTLLVNFPALADTMEAHLQARYDHAPGDMSGTALKHFQDRLDSFRHGIEVLRS